MKMVELLLTENVDNLGIVGDVVKVRPGYARNFLMPRGYATKPTPAAVARLAERRRQVEQELAAKRQALETMLTRLEGFELTMQRAANEQGVLFGGVSQHDIAQALREAGFAIDDRAVRIGEQIKRLDSYRVPIQLASDLRTEIKLWVVSDKPAEPAEGETEAAPAEGAEQPESGERQQPNHSEH